jgi:hypothetical protein
MPPITDHMIRRRCGAVTDYDRMHGEALEKVVPVLADRVRDLEDRVADLETKLRRLLSDEWRGPERERPAGNS